MSRALFLLMPALVFPAQASSIPDAEEVRSGIWVLRGTPSDGTYSAMKNNRITHVIDLRRDGEPSLNGDTEPSRLSELGVQYIRYAVAKVPLSSDLDFFRTILKDLPRGSRVLIHCADGNRAAAMVCPWMVLDRGMAIEEAMKTAKVAGLKFPETEAAVRRYLASQGRS